jgi:hypothetical protein
MTSFEIQFVTAANTFAIAHRYSAYYSWKYREHTDHEIYW